MFALSWLNIGPFFVFFVEHLVSLQKEEDFSRKGPKFVLKLVHLCCTTYLDEYLTQPGTSSWHFFFLHFWVFLCFFFAEATIFVVLSAKNAILKTPKVQKHYLWAHLCYMLLPKCLFFSAFFMFGVLGISKFWRDVFWCVAKRQKYKIPKQKQTKHNKKHDVNDTKSKFLQHKTRQQAETTKEHLETKGQQIKKKQEPKTEMSNKDWTNLNPPPKKKNTRIAGKKRDFIRNRKRETQTTQHNKHKQQKVQNKNNT